MSHGESAAPRENGPDPSFQGGSTQAGDAGRASDNGGSPPNRERSEERAPRPDVVDVAPND